MNNTISKIAAMLLMAITAMAFTSCENDDIDEAYDLNGIWQGSIYGNYYSDRYDYGNNWDTEIRFVQDGTFSNGGWGEEVDYSIDGRRYYRSDFIWEVRNGRIYMDYNDGYRIIIHDYELYSRGGIRRFKGMFEDYDTGERLASFDLVKTNDWSDWAKKHNAVFEASGQK